MAKKGPLDDVFEQLAELMSKIDEKGDQFSEDKLSPSVREQVNSLKEFISKFKQTSDDLFRQAGIDPDKLAGKNEWKDAPSKKGREMLERLESMKKDLTERKRLFQQALNQPAPEGNLSSEGKKGSKKAQAKKKQKLKKKFRGMGGDKWMKM